MRVMMRVWMPASPSGWSAGSFLDGKAGAGTPGDSVPGLWGGQGLPEQHAALSLQPAACHHAGLRLLPPQGRQVPTLPASTSCTADTWQIASQWPRSPMPGSRVCLRVWRSWEGSSSDCLVGHSLHMQVTAKLSLYYHYNGMHHARPILAEKLDCSLMLKLPGCEYKCLAGTCARHPLSASGWTWLTSGQLGTFA